MCDHKHSRKFIEDLINSFLMDEIIPDILIDVLSGKKYLVSINIHNITHMYNAGHKCCDFLLKSLFPFGTELERV